MTLYEITLKNRINNEIETVIDTDEGRHYYNRSAVYEVISYKEYKNTVDNQ